MLVQTLQLDILSTVNAKENTLPPLLVLPQGNSFRNRNNCIMHPPLTKHRITHLHPAVHLHFRNPITRRTITEEIALLVLLLRSPRSQTHPLIYPSPFHLHTRPRSLNNIPLSHKHQRQERHPHLVWRTLLSQMISMAPNPGPNSTIHRLLSCLQISSLSRPMQNQTTHRFEIRRGVHLRIKDSRLTSLLVHTVKASRLQSSGWRPTITEGMGEGYREVSVSRRNHQASTEPTPRGAVAVSLLLCGNDTHHK